MTGGPDATLRALTGYCLRRASVAAMADFARVFARHGLRRTTFSVLTLVVERPGLRQAQVAAALAIERPNLVQIVGELEGLGLLRRETDAEDRRAQALHPTLKGRRLFTEAMADVAEQEERLLDGLTPAQVEALRGALVIIERNAGMQREAAHDEQVSRA